MNETLEILVDAVCSCGHTLKRQTQQTISQQVSLAALCQAAVVAADGTRCLCGAWDNRMGTAQVGYRLPGIEQWVIATTDLRRGARPTSLTLRDRMPSYEHCGEVLSALPVEEITTALTIGQPVSVQAAWKEGLFYASLGKTMSFPTGPLTCHVLPAGSNKGLLDLSALAVEDGPSTWLDESQWRLLEEGSVVAVVDGSLEIVTSLTTEIASHMQLAVETHPNNRLVVSRRQGLFSHALNASVLLATAVAKGHLPMVEIASTLASTFQKLTKFDAHGHKVISRLEVFDYKPVDGQEAVLAVSTGRATTLVDVAAYTSADADRRSRMLNSWRRRLS